eukprot:COSAG01_NODE_3434_length_6100_cov_7.180970_9_plen_506_part_00
MFLNPPLLNPPLLVPPSGGGLQPELARLAGSACLMLLLLLTSLPAHRTPAWSERWNMTTPGAWFSGVCLFGADDVDSATDSNSTALTFGFSAGDWYNPPYPSRFGTAPLAAPHQATVTPLPSQPGSAWPCRGTRDRVAFTGENFETLAPVLAVFGADGHAVWQARLPGTVRESWARGALGATSANGELATFGVTFTDSAATTERAQILVWNMSTTPSAAALLLNDSFANGTGIEAVLQSGSGEVVVAVAAVMDSAGTQHAAEVRVYDVVAGTISAFTVGWVAASCLSADGRRLVLATADSSNSLLVYKLGRRSQYERLLNTTYPELPGRPTYASSCATSNGGALWVTFPLFWGVSTLNQSAVAFWRTIPSKQQLPATQQRSGAAPTSLWLSDPVAPTLEDAISSSVYLEGHGLFGLTTWGGALDPATGRTPPTLHLFSERDPGTPLLQIATPGLGGNCSGSLMHLDMAFDAASNALHVLAAGLNYHENVGSSAGVLYLWDLVGLL